MEETKKVSEEETEQESEPKDDTGKEEEQESDDDVPDDIPAGPGRSFLRDLLSETVIGKHENQRTLRDH